MRARAVILVGLAASGLSFSSPDLRRPAVDPTVKIDLIETLFLPSVKYVTIHYEIQPNRVYILQGATNISDPKWETLVTHRAFPFQTHFIHADELTNTTRHYRLLVTP